MAVTFAHRATWCAAVASDDNAKAPAPSRSTTRRLRRVRVIQIREAYALERHYGGGYELRDR